MLRTYSHVFRYLPIKSSSVRGNLILRKWQARYINKICMNYAINSKSFFLFVRVSEPHFLGWCSSSSTSHSACCGKKCEMFHREEEKYVLNAFACVAMMKRCRLICSCVFTLQCNERDFFCLLPQVPFFTCYL